MSVKLVPRYLQAWHISMAFKNWVVTVLFPWSIAGIPRGNCCTAYVGVRLKDTGDYGVSGLK